MSPELRIKGIRKGLSIFFLTGIGLSFPLWSSDRFFPSIPVFSQLEIVALPLEYFFFVILLTFLVLSFFSSHKAFMLLVIISITILVLFDQMRWQPWVYMYSLMFIALLAAPGSPEGNRIRMNMLRILVTGVYFWSGVHKINPGFIDHTWHNILTRFFHVQDKNLLDFMLVSGYFVSFMEIMISAGLLVPRIRNAAVCLAVSSHIFILLFLSPLGIDANTVVYPWNLAMIVFVILLFWNEKSPIAFWPAVIQRRVAQLAIILLTWILPFLNFFGWWDYFLSFSLYSDKSSVFYIAVEEKEIPKMDSRLKSFFVDLPGISGGGLIDVGKWAMHELNVPLYPERRVFRKVARSFCDLGVEKGKIVFLELKRPLREGKYFSFTCEDL